VDDDKDMQAPTDAGDWAEVADALNTLGASIARATKAAVDNEENRRRLRELSEGLASLAQKAGESIETAAATPEGQRVKAVVVQAAETVREVGDKAADHARPHFVSALQAANEKFRKAAEQWEVPVEPAPAAAEPVPAPVAGYVAFADLAEPAPESAPTGTPEVAATVAPEAPAPEALAPEAPAAPAPYVPSRAFEATPVSTDKLEAVRIAHERFVAERKAAEEAATAAKAAAGASDEVPRDETVIGPEPGAEGTDSGDRSMW